MWKNYITQNIKNFINTYIWELPKPSNNKSYKNISELLEYLNRKEPIIQRIYKKIYYTLQYVFNLPKETFYTIRRGLQRGYNGWANEDTWNLSSYLSKVIYESVTELKKSSHGYALTLEYDGSFEYGDNSENERIWYAKNETAWCDILDTIIYAFKLNHEIAIGNRESYQPRKDLKLSEYKDKYLTLKEEMKRRKGMLYFTQYFQNLWD
jgi:hypothetical protein